MADDIDIANDRAAADLERSIAAARANMPLETGPERCEECDERIPLIRRQMGYSKCVPCAAMAERNNQLFAGRG